MAAHREHGLPGELTRRPRWVRYSDAKVPLTVRGRAASSTNPATWSRYADVKSSTAGVGFGFVLNGDGIVCVDLDGCLDPSGIPNEAAESFLKLAGATYVEISPSGRGLHIWGRAQLAAGRCRTVMGTPVEVYPSGRYMTVTGRRFGAAPPRLADVAGLLRALLGDDQ